MSAIWSERQQASIWSYQLQKEPKYICPNANDGKHHDSYGDLSCLIPTFSGWRCLACNHVSFEVSDEALNFMKADLAWMDDLVPLESEAPSLTSQELGDAS